MKKEEKILNSINGLQKAKAPDFFYTRLIGKMQQQSAAQNVASFSLQPVFSAAALCLLLAINIFSLMQFNKTEKVQSFPQAKQSSSIDAFAEAYNMNTEFIYE
jgi:hypothetical protein